MYRKLKAKHSPQSTNPQAPCNNFLLYNTNVRPFKFSKLRRTNSRLKKKNERCKKSDMLLFAAKYFSST